jgi:hypothetical protein
MKFIDHMCHCNFCQTPKYEYEFLFLIKLIALIKLKKYFIDTAIIIKMYSKKINCFKD